MKVTFFPNTDTLLVNMTIEHAKQQMNVTEFSDQLAAGEPAPPCPVKDRLRRNRNRYIALIPMRGLSCRICWLS